MMKIAAALSLMAVLLFGCTSTPIATTSASVDFGAPTLALINSYRASRGLATLQERPELRALAQEHSRNQASQGRMGHAGFQQRMARSRAAGTGARCAENVGHGYRNAQQLFEGWRGSPVHNENMLRPHLRYAAVSVVGAYSTFLACG